MFKKIFLILIISIFSPTFFSMAIARTSHVNPNIERLMNASYGIIKVSLYSEEENSNMGTIKVDAGRGVLFKNNKEKLFLTCSHILSGNVPGFLMAEKYIIVKNWEEYEKKKNILITKVIKKMSKEEFNVFFNSYTFTENTIGIDQKNISKDKESDAAYVALDNYHNYTDLNFVTYNDFDFDFDYKIGRKIGVWGTPFFLGEWYREDVIASSIPESSFVIIAAGCGPGDSGGIAVSPDSEKIIGILSRVTAENMGASGAGEIQIPIPNGFVIKISSFFNILQIKKQ